MSMNDDRYSRWWLKPFSSTIPRAKVMKKIGSGSSGYVFKVRIDGVIYALKMASETPPQCAIYTPNSSNFSLSSSSSTQSSVHPSSEERSLEPIMTSFWWSVVLMALSLIKAWTESTHLFAMAGSRFLLRLRCTWLGHLVCISFYGIDHLELKMSGFEEFCMNTLTAKRLPTSRLHHR